MPFFGDFHTHSTLDDGENTLWEMAEGACALGLTHLGLSGHSYGPQDADFCIPAEQVPVYLREARAVQEAYRGRLEVLVGLELDYFGQKPQGLDYVIGSVHSVEGGGRLWSVDHRAELTRQAVEEAFGGDWYRLTDAYYDLVADLPRKTGCSWVGHFDLVTKFNERSPAFDQKSPRYLRRAKEVLAYLVELGVPLEVNTGAMCRGYRSAPYPDRPLLELLAQLGGQVLLCSDAHSVSGLCHGFAPVLEQLTALGLSPLVEKSWAKTLCETPFRLG